MIKGHLENSNAVTWRGSFSHKGIHKCLVFSSCVSHMLSSAGRVSLSLHLPMSATSCVHRNTKCWKTRRKSGAHSVQLLKQALAGDDMTLVDVSDFFFCSGDGERGVRGARRWGGRSCNENPRTGGVSQERGGGGPRG